MPRSEGVPRGTPGPGVVERGLADYAGLVREWAARVDLVAPGDLDRFESRHIADSLRLLRLLRSLPPGPAVDVGSGAGLPGVPLAIADPSRPWRLLEPRRMRLAFLEEVVRALALDCEVVALTAERAAEDPRLRRAHVLAVARALAPPAAAFRLLGPLVAPGGVAAVFVGARELPPGAEEWAQGVAIMRAGGESDQGGGA
jgi:16S rRNA (guanine527-N7)-methyltransferase